MNGRRSSAEATTPHLSRSRPPTPPRRVGGGADRPGVGSERRQGAAVHDLVIRNGTVIDGLGWSSGRRPTSPSTTVASPRWATVDRARARGARRHRPRGHARLRRRPHPLRRPGHVGPAAHAVDLARRHHRGDGQLRRRLRAGRARPPRLAHRSDGGRRGHPRRGAARRRSTGTGSRSASTSTRSTASRARSTSPPRSPHGAVRAFVMGERGAANEPATADDIARMAELVAEGVAPGAVGLSVNRLELHKAVDGREVPGTFAAHRRDLRPRARGARGFTRRGVHHHPARRRRRATARSGTDEIDWLSRLLARDGPARSRSRSVVERRGRSGATGSTASSARTRRRRASCRRWARTARACSAGCARRTRSRPPDLRGARAPARRRARAGAWPTRREGRDPRRASRARHPAPPRPHARAGRRGVPVAPRARATSPIPSTSLAARGRALGPRSRGAPLRLDHRRRRRRARPLLPRRLSRQPRRQRRAARRTRRACSASATAARTST